MAAPEEHACYTLVVEVDFEHSVCDVILRLYQCRGTQRVLLRFQEIYNLCRRLQRSGDHPWDDTDQRFLRRLWSLVNRPALLKKNLEVVKLTKAQFVRLAAYWSDHPQRFVDRRTQCPYSTSAATANLHYELTVHGATSRLDAVVTAPGGARFFYYRATATTVGSRTQLSFKGNAYFFEYPPDRSLFDLVFSERNPEIPTDRIVKHLPAVLQGRLDLLRGPSVRTVSKPGTIRVQLVPDGADILLTADIDGSRLQLDGPESLEPATLVRRGSRFDVHVRTAEGLREMVDELKSLRAQDTGGLRYRVRGDAGAIDRLYSVCGALRDRVALDVAPELQLAFAGSEAVETELQIGPGTGWFDIRVSCRVGTTAIDDDAVAHALRNDSRYVRTRGGMWVRLDPERLRSLAEELADSGLELGDNRITADRLATISKHVVRLPDLRLTEDAAAIARRLSAAGAVEVPACLSDDLSLRPYQREGAEFLFRCSGYQLGCILADDMGLGKTRQVLAHLVARRKTGLATQPTLVVCPASVAAVWLDEAAKFAPELKLVACSGTRDARRKILACLGESAVLVATFAIVRNDAAVLRKMTFDTIVVDEAQTIKNPDAAVTRSLCSLHAHHRVAVTGTPLENKLLDLWSIVDFLNPGYLGSRDGFRLRYSGASGSGSLAARIAAFLLRRTKDMVGSELPEKTVAVLRMPLSGTQRKMYDRELREARSGVRKKGPTALLAALTRLRQICCHPDLLCAPAATTAAPRDSSAVDNELSSKLDCLITRIMELNSEGHAVLVFSQFTRMLDIIEQRCDRIPLYKITGSTPVERRRQLVADFQESQDPGVFLLSLKAAGTGLTLTRADYVFIYDPWWNPATEDQAIDRTHRIGQHKPVFAYRLIAADTVEDGVSRMQVAKRRLFQDVIDGAASHGSGGMTSEDMIALLMD